MEEKAKSSEGGSITLSKLTIWKTATFVFAALFIIALLTGGFGIGGSTTGNVVNNGDVQAPGPSADIKVNIGSGDPILGNKDAPIKIVEFSDFQCPFCERAYSGAVAGIKSSEAFKNGDVAIVFKHFPLNSIHPYAQKAAEAAECANKQGKFWEYHNMLFENQQALDIPSLKNYASKLGLDTGKFNKCLDGGEATAKVNKDSQEAQAAGGQGTPYFVLINKKGDTQAVSGAVPYANFEAAISSLK